MKSIAELMRQGVVLGDGGYLIELERRGYVDSGSGREQVGTGRGSGQFTPEVAIENPDALRELHREFLGAGAGASSTDFLWDAREAVVAPVTARKPRRSMPQRYGWPRKWPARRRSWPEASRAHSLWSAKAWMRSAKRAITSRSRFGCSRMPAWIF